MLSLLAPIALMMTAQSAAPPLPTDTPLSPLPFAQQTALRCSVAFALGAEQQREGKVGKGWPNLGERGREFFARSMAQLMDEAKLTREDVANRVVHERDDLRQPGVLDATMPGCLVLLDASGL